MDIKLAAAIVHDIKNALGVLEGELLNMTSEPTRERAVSAHGNCTMLRERLIGFLTLYKASSQGLHAQVEALSPEDFLRALVRESTASQAGIDISVNVQGMPVLGFFDEHLVGLALEAALQNAARFARSAIEIGCTGEEGGGLVFSVRDDGPGLGAKEDKPSTGLGMELCQAIAQAHRRGDQCGSVSLQNHADGGAVFTLHLP